jgi:hypothetical protein
MSIAAQPEAMRSAQPGAMTFGAVALAFVIATAAIAGFLPIEFSIVSVFLCAGPHNWVEARYFLSRLPGRWGRLSGYFIFAFSGVFALTAAFAAMPYLLRYFDSGYDGWMSSYAAWDTLLVLWIATLVHMRSRQNPRRNWAWIWPVAFLIVALAWLSPFLWGLGLVYLHPLIALWILDREIRRTRPEYRGVYHLCLLAIPVCLGLLWWRLADAPPLVGDDLLTQITEHSGASYLTGISSHCLVATHTFLEAVHYGVWLIAIPWLGAKTNLWSVPDMALGRRSFSWTLAMQIFLLLGAGVVVVLWLCFWADYPVTRSVYFTVAMLHVLAEAPFLLRAL